MGSCRGHAILRFIFFFRVHDYILCVVCAVIALAVGKVRPFCRPFSWTDPSIDFPFANTETFPTWSLFLISILSAVVYVLGEAARHCWLRHSQGGVLTHDPYSKNTWLLVESEHHGGGHRVRTTDAKDNFCNAAVSPLQPTSPLFHPPLSANAQAAINVVAADTLTNRGVDAQEMQAGLSTAAVAPVESRLVQSRLSPTNAHNDHTEHCGALSETSAPSSGTAEAVLNKGTAHTYTLPRPWQRFLLHAHMWVLTQAFSVFFTLMVVDVVKVYAGRLRPDFLARLRQKGFTPQSVDVDYCGVAREGRLSFPSGHSGIGFAALLPLCFYVLHSLHGFRHGGVSLWRIIIALLPLILAICIAVSRTRDNRHNFDDIFAGSAIGIIGALIAIKAIMMVDGQTGQLVPRLAHHR
ncbi:hypothetical protein JKF63_06545 [Porcisia hertigi]|uniref:Phosphatidic acid phosphatase type 2/haloperoxidase domain-containing protein n=1 Tax=Porcisia hertigi TaxID=2761500 RepID=A0A836IVE3_9TRYP|nr:hypothetical protein JKF63_06545 [Porcisia hertigi]